MIEIKGTAILRDGDEIGTIQGATATLTSKVGPRIIGQIRQAVGNPDLAVVVGNAETIVEEVEDVPDVPETPPDVPESAPASTPPEPEPATPTPPVEPPKTGLDRLLDLVATGEIPSPPEHNPATGDKDPAFVAWFKAHATADEIAVKYPPDRRLPQPGDYEKGEHARLNRKLPGEVPDTAE